MKSIAVSDYECSTCFYYNRFYYESAYDIPKGGVCMRFPQEVEKSPEAVCGEHSSMNQDASHAASSAFVAMHRRRPNFHLVTK